MTDRDLLVKELQGVQGAIDFNRTRMIDFLFKYLDSNVLVPSPEIQILEDDKAQLHRRRDKILKAIQGLPENISD
jgi:hypothetical protein